MLPFTLAVTHIKVPHHESPVKFVASVMDCVENTEITNSNNDAGNECKLAKEGSIGAKRGTETVYNGDVGEMSV